MSITITAHIVVFDYGEVISATPSEQDRAIILELADAKREPFWAAYWRHRPSLDVADLTVTQYWRAIENDVGAFWDSRRLHQLYLADFRSWLVLDQPTLQVLLDLKAGGTRLAMLSNAGPDFSSYYRSGMLGHLFEQIFTSAELGVLKPEPAIFRAVLDRLGVPASEIIFVDNLPQNVRVAAELGITAHHYTDAPRLRTFLQTYAEPGAVNPAPPVGPTLSAAPPKTRDHFHDHY